MPSSGVELKAKLHSLYSFFSCLIARGLKVRILGNQTLKIKIPLPPILPSPLFQEILIIFPLVHFICLYYISTEETICCLFLHVLTTYRCIKWYRCIATFRGKQFFPRFSKQGKQKLTFEVGLKLTTFSVFCSLNNLPGRYLLLWTGIKCKKSESTQFISNY